MTVLAFPKSIRQPNQGAAIAAPYRNGLKVLWTGAHGQNTNLAPGGVGQTAYGTQAGLGASRVGKALAFGSASDTNAQYAVTSNVTTLTLLVCVQFYNTGATEGFFQWEILSNSATSGNPRLLLQNNSGDIRYYDGSGYVLTESGVGTAGSVHNIVIRSTPSETFYYRNGRKTATSAPGTNTGNAIYFGSGYSTAARSYQPIGAWWEADIGDAAALELSVNPWAVFQAPARRLHLNAIAAGGSAIAVKSNYYRMMRGA